MTRLACTLSAACVAAALICGSAFAAKDKKPAAKAATCPACKMALATKKDKDHTMAVKVGGKTYYCCSKCDMNKKADAKHAHKGGEKKK